LRQRELVASIAIDRGQHGAAGREVVGVTAAKPLPVPLQTPRAHSLWPRLPDHPHKVNMQRTPRRPEAAFAQTEEPNIVHSQQRSSLGLLSRRICGICERGRVEATRITVGQDAILIRCVVINAAMCRAVAVYRFG